jgi:hypothetical protein
MLSTLDEELEDAAAMLSARDQVRFQTGSAVKQRLQIPCMRIMSSTVVTRP